jgi:hypothetical protein
MMVDPTREEKRQQLHQEIQSLLGEAVPFREGMLKITQTAQVENWPWDRYLTERASLKRRLADIDQELQKRYAALEALDRTPEGESLPPAAGPTEI